MKKLIVLLFLACCVSGWAQSAPQPKHEAIKFAASATYFGESAFAQIWAQHDGARQCVAEDNRGGAGKLFNTADGFGHRPRDYRVYATGGAILGVATLLELRHHRTAAKRILLFAGTAQNGVAGATWWAGCN